MRLAVAVSALILVTASAGNAWVSGVIIGTVAVVALTKFAEWEEWVTLLLGVWVVVSPWVLGFVLTTAATWVHVIVGLIVAIVAAVKLWQVAATAAPDRASVSRRAGAFPHPLGKPLSSLTANQ